MNTFTQQFLILFSESQCRLTVSPPDTCVQHDGVAAAGGADKGRRQEVGGHQCSHRANSGLRGLRGLGAATAQNYWRCLK